MKMKENNKILLFLRDYFADIVDKYDDVGLQLDSYYAFIEDLYRSKKITFNECDTITDNICELIDFVLYVISNCPNVELHIDKKNF